ncbi:recombinase family protein [Mycolicibacterium rhodesiae]|uniref:Recombinase family protein n=1 Tax=Mycolicibacterium rhodesiae TaxID=36814 RepID=A0A1X0ISC8_MYCRH|nr:recombinase family protein [Mycolicibacterium rhodesiae]MCV7346986.1 recombinase family protein [Mycolicibacterium rhodesiae]ORB50800.1 recombinase family protein [Mycolicibacterium rhodesiae]
MSPPRALIVVRLSRVTDATTSPERQVAKCRELIEQRGYVEVGIAEDLDVSAGKTTPFDRPQLGKWLTTRRGEFDVIVFFRVDRIVRRLFDLADLIRWSREHGVTLVSATEAHFDLSSDFGDIIALLIAKVAELELAAISERNASAFRHNFAKGKYRGGIPPWGYIPEHDDNGDWRLVQDPEQVEVILEVVERVLAGEPLRALAHELTKREVLTPKDRFAQVRGREVVGYEWHPGPLKRALTSHTLLGRVVTREQPLDAQGRPQRDAKGRKVFGDDVLVTADDGSPIVRAEPIVSRDVFDRLGVELAGRENRKEPTKRTSGLLLRIIYCGECGRPAYRLKGGVGRKPRYRCSSAQKVNGSCGNKTIPLEYADAEVERQILKNMGPLERRRRVWFAGNDHTDELAEVNSALEDLTDQLGVGVFKRGTPQRAKLDQRIAALSARQAELSSVPSQPAGWRYEPTGELFSDWWNDQDDEAKNIWLRQSGFRYEWSSHSDERGRVVVDRFEQVGDLEMDLDGDQVFGPLVDIMAALSDPSNFEDAPAE